MIARADNFSVNAFLARFKPYPTLSRAEELELITKAQAGDRRAMDTLTRAHVRFVVKAAKCYGSKSLAFDDLAMEGLSGFCIAVRKFDPARGNKLITLAAWWVRQAITRAMDDKGSQIRIPHNVHRMVIEAKKADGYGKPLSKGQKKALDVWALRDTVSLDSAPDEDSQGLKATLAVEPDESFETDDELRDYLAALPPKERAIIQDRYGISHGNPETLEEIGTRHGVCKERVRQIVKSAIGKMAVCARRRRKAGL